MCPASASKTPEIKTTCPKVMCQRVDVRRGDLPSQNPYKYRMCPVSVSFHPRPPDIKVTSTRSMRGVKISPKILCNHSRYAHCLVRKIERTDGMYCTKHAVHRRMWIFEHFFKVTQLRFMRRFSQSPRAPHTRYNPKIPYGNSRRPTVCLLYYHVRCSFFRDTSTNNAMCCVEAPSPTSHVRTRATLTPLHEYRMCSSRLSYKYLRPKIMALPPSSAYLYENGDCSQNAL
jgi:hypothetical protein